jgi:hypothetical protein
MPRTLSDIELERIKLKLREALGRDLTPEESKYFGLSSGIVPEEPPPQAKAAANRRKN